MLKQGIRILKKLGLLEKVNIEGYQYLNKKKFKIPLIKQLGYPNLFENESWMIELFKILPEQEGVFIDVGANIGQTLLKFRSVFPSAKYIGFEPNPACVFYLQELIKLNGFRNIEVLPTGISTKDGIATINFYNESSSDSSASLIPEFRPEEKIFRKEIIVVNRFETIREKLEIDAIRTIKIDVEGYELEVLSSFEKQIEIFRPQILLEILPVYNKEELPIRYERQEKIEALFKKHKYKIYRVKKAKEEFHRLESIEKIGIHGDIDLCDYIVLPEEQEFRV